MMRSIVRVLVVVLALLALVGTVSAQINSPANGFIGGDSLFCNSVRGCWLLNSNRPANGSVPALLGEFPQADIQAALTTCAAEGHNVEIGTINGTYGPFTLSAVYDGPNADPVCSLQVNGTEAEGKPAKPYSFAPKSDGNYSPMPVPVPAEGEESISIIVLPHGFCEFDRNPGLPSDNGIDKGGFDLYTWVGSPNVANLKFIGWKATSNGYQTCLP